MPTISIRGITFDTTSAEAAVAQRWTAPLQTAAQTLLDSAPNFDPRLQPALASATLGPLFRGLVELLTDATAMLAAAGVTSAPPNPALASTVEDLISRYLEGFLVALDRLLRDWDSLGTIFFTQGSADTAIRYQLVALQSADPLPDALAQGGIASLVLRLTIGNSDTSSPGKLDAAVVYVPRDVECDCALVGHTARLCSCGPAYVPRATPCEHPWCRSVAERINTQLAEPDAIPTCLVWPAAPASTDDRAPADAYGYRAHLSTEQPADNTVTSAQAPEVAAFSRTLGRQLALVFAAGARAVTTRDFAIHRLRPYWLGLDGAFEVPNDTLGSTGMFDAHDGPLAPAARSPTSPAFFGLFVASSGSATSPPTRAPVSVADVRRGCAETLEALAALGPELGDRFRNGRNLVSWFRAREQDETRGHQQRWLQLLSVASSWSDWQALERETAQWRADDDAEWTTRWFGELIAQLQSTFSAWPQLPPEATEVLAPLNDRVTGALGVRRFPDVQVAGVLQLAPSEREPIWNALVAMAQLLSGYFRHTPWRNPLETSWNPLPTSALVDFEVADHARARLPYFVHRLQQASLWAASTGQEVKLADYADAPPPRLARATFFPEPMALATARQLDRLANPGIRAWLVSSIPALMENPSATPRLPPPSLLTPELRA